MTSAMALCLNKVPLLGHGIKASTCIFGNHNPTGNNPSSTPTVTASTLIVLPSFSSEEKVFILCRLIQCSPFQLSYLPQHFAPLTKPSCGPFLSRLPTENGLPSETHSGPSPGYSCPSPSPDPLPDLRVQPSPLLAILGLFTSVSRSDCQFTVLMEN